MLTIPDLVERPHGDYTKDDSHWHLYVLALCAHYNLTRTNIAGFLGIKVSTMDNHPLTINAIQHGQALFAAKVMQELMLVALAEPNDYPEGIERNQVRALKQDTLKQLAKNNERREELKQLNSEGEATREVIKSLSDVELRAKVSELLQTA